MSEISDERKLKMLRLILEMLEDSKSFPKGLESFLEDWGL